ncbi:hypothetical protein ACFFIR_13760 [Microbacterium arthrosphaerae]|uniref:hypothetical protein n=1 Tax=Microbacterium arthrosphaerae TaxID=792652 RepID=UPI0035E79E7A
MDAWIWGAVAMALVLVVAGGIAWWLARGCVLTMVGATGAILGGVISLVTVSVMLDPDTALRAAGILTVVSGAWLLAWALAGGIRGQRLLRAEQRPDAATPAPAPRTAATPGTVSPGAAAPTAAAVRARHI